MVFSSNIFLFAFLPLTLLFYFLLPKNLATKNFRNSVLLIASLLFYAWGEAQYLVLLLISIAANYFFGMWIEKSNVTLSLTKGDQPHGSSCAGKLSMTNFFLCRKAVLFYATACNLALLGYFKYANFLVENLNAVLANFSDYKIILNKVHLPIGISFFTFHAISYLVDIYRQKCHAQKNFFDLALYIAFFPQLVAGPIVRYNFIAKYLNQRRHNFFFAAYGIRRFIIGLGKKVIIANPLGELADAVFNSPISEINQAFAWFGIVCYSLQIYFDFSGYSDMAVGLARIFGFKFPENFNYPYISRSIREFWRRWHMSLSAWLRDYVYIALGGNRVPLYRQYLNLIIVFFLCGLWHGASWNFVIWGMFHGAFLIFERLKIGENFVNFLPKLLQNFYAIFVVMIGWVFFRSPDLAHALAYLKTMFLGNEIITISNQVARLGQSHFILLVLACALIGFSPFIKNLALKLMRKNKIFIGFFDVILIAIFLFSVVRISAATHNPFIYFQF